MGENNLDTATLAQAPSAPVAAEEAATPLLPGTTIAFKGPVKLRPVQQQAFDKNKPVYAPPPFAAFQKEEVDSTTTPVITPVTTPVAASEPVLAAPIQGESAKQTMVAEKASEKNESSVSEPALVNTKNETEITSAEVVTPEVDLEKLFNEAPKMNAPVSKAPDVSVDVLALPQVRQVVEKVKTVVNIPEINTLEEVAELVEGQHQLLNKMVEERKQMERAQQQKDPVVAHIEKMIAAGRPLSEISRGLAILDRNYEAKNQDGKHKVSDRDVFYEWLSAQAREMGENLTDEKMQEEWQEFQGKSLADRSTQLSTWRKALQARNEQDLKAWEAIRNEAEQTAQILDQNNPVVQQWQKVYDTYTNAITTEVPKVRKIENVSIPENVIKSHILPAALDFNSFMNNVLFDEDGTFKAETYVKLLLTEDKRMPKSIREAVVKSINNERLRQAEKHPVVVKNLENEVRAKLAMEKAMPQTATPSAPVAVGTPRIANTPEEIQKSLEVAKATGTKFVIKPFTSAALNR